MAANLNSGLSYLPRSCVFCVHLPACNYPALSLVCAFTSSLQSLSVKPNDGSKKEGDGRGAL